MRVADNLQIVNEQIEAACKRSNRQMDEVELIAVTKYVSIERALEAVEAGVCHIGENRDDGLKNKYQSLPEQTIWHFIGTLQTRKVKSIIDEVDYIHSLDRLSLAKEINKRASKKVKCFIQVNVSGEESKHGLSPKEVEPFIRELESFEQIEIVGLMTMAPYIENKNELRGYFKQLRVLRDQISSLNMKHAPCTELSMGMSNDFELAIEEGATFIRIGTALVGNER